MSRKWNAEMQETHSDFIHGQAVLGIAVIGRAVSKGNLCVTRRVYSTGNGVAYSEDKKIDRVPST